MSRTRYNLDHEFSQLIKKLSALGDNQRYALHRFLTDMQFQAKYKGKKQFTIAQVYKMLHTAAEKTS